MKDKSKVNFIVLADCRCGGTALVRTLNKHPQLFVLGEILSPDQPYFDLPPDFDKFLKDTFGYCNGWHLQRFQIPDVYSWYKLAKYPNLKVINLSRNNKIEQYASFRMAQETKLWHERPEEMPKIVWDQKDYERQASGWIEGKLWTDHVFSYSPRLDISFEDIVEDFGGVLNRCQDFLQIEKIDLEPAMRRMDPVDYSKVFIGWPG